MPARKRSTELSRTAVCARYMREAITPARMTEVRKKVKIGDKIIIVPVKCGEGEQKGTVVGIYRSFATVKTEEWNLRECFVVGGNEAE